MKHGYIFVGLSNRGKTFYLAFPENRVLVDNPVVRLYITTLSSTPVQVHIRMPFMTDPEFDSLAVGITRIVQPGKLLVEEFSYNVHIQGTNFDDKGMIVEANNTISIQVGQLNDLSSDTYLAFPVESLGNDYHVITYIYTEESSYRQGPTQILIVGIEEFTSVNLTLPVVARDAITELITMGINCFGMNSGTCTFTLQWCQVLQIQSLKDLTGSHITSDWPVSVFAGTVWTSVKTEFMGDHMVEQVPPSSTWGGEFILIPTVNRTSGDVVRIFAKENNTKVVVKLYHPNEEEVVKMDIELKTYYDMVLPSTAYMRIISNMAIFVTQYSMSSGADDFKFSDPFMSYIPPTAQYPTSISFSDISSTIHPFYNRIALITNASNINNIYLNNEPIKIFTPDKWKDVPGTKFKINTVFLPFKLTNTEKGTLYIISSKEPYTVIGGMLYGLKFQESFGSVLGQEMNQLIVRCHNITMQWEDSFDNDCDGLTDEEIANGIDDDNDGVIDEDVFNDKLTRQYEKLLVNAGKFTTNGDKIEPTENMYATDLSGQDHQDHSSSDPQDHSSSDPNLANIKRLFTMPSVSRAYNDIPVTKENFVGPNSENGISITTHDSMFRNDGTEFNLNIPLKKTTTILFETQGVTHNNEFITKLLHRTKLNQEDTVTKSIINKLKGITQTSNGEPYTLNQEFQNSLQTSPNGTGFNSDPVQGNNNHREPTTESGLNINKNKTLHTIGDKDNFIDQIRTITNKDSDGTQDLKTITLTLPKEGLVWRYTTRVESKLTINGETSNNSNFEKIESGQTINDNSDGGLSTSTPYTLSKNNLSSMLTQSDRTTPYKYSILKENIEMIIIPICIITGVPLLCCLFVVLKALIRACSSKQNKIGPDKKCNKFNHSVSRVNDAKLTNLELSNVEAHKSLVPKSLHIDCRSADSKGFGYNFAEYYKKRQYTSDQCKHYINEQIRMKNKTSIDEIKRKKQLSTSKGT